MPKLNVNIDHVATLRQVRRALEPDPVAAAIIVELAGAQGITVHLREDRRHIQDRDLRLLREVIRTKLNLEMAATKEMVEIALSIKPDMITLVPEKREELTTEGGLDLSSQAEVLSKTIRSLQEGGIFVSLFINPDLSQVKMASKLKADYVEIHTGLYAQTKTEDEERMELEKIVHAAVGAKKLGLRVNAGHGLTYENVTKVAKVEAIEELSIGHSIIARAVLVGLERAVREMLALVK